MEAAKLLACVPLRCARTAAGLRLDSQLPNWRVLQGAVDALSATTSSSHLSRARTGWRDTLEWCTANGIVCNGSLDALTTRTFLLATNDRARSNSTNLQEPAARDGASVQVDRKVTFIWLQKHFGMDFMTNEPSIKALASKIARPTRPFAPVTFKIMGHLENLAKNVHAPNACRVFGAAFTLMAYSVSRFQQLQDSKWDGYLPDMRCIRGINHVEKAKSAGGARSRFFYFPIDGIARNNWHLVLIESRSQRPFATFLFPDFEGGDILKAARLRNSPCSAAKALRAFRQILVAYCEVPPSRVHKFGFASLKRLLIELAMARGESPRRLNDLGRWAFSRLQQSEALPDPALIAAWEQRQLAMPRHYATLAFEREVCSILVTQLQAARAHISRLGGLAALPASTSTTGWDSIVSCSFATHSGSIRQTPELPAPARLLALPSP